MKKTYVIDTNVFLTNHESVKSYGNNDIVVPSKYCPMLRIKTGVPLKDCNPEVFTQEWVDFETKHWNNK